MTERKAKIILLAERVSCSADEVVYATLGLLAELKDQVLTITADNVHFSFELFGYCEPPCLQINQSTGRAAYRTPTGRAAYRTHRR